MIGRLWVRSDGRLGLCLLHGSSPLKPNRVYEIAECDGEVVLTDIGPSCMAPSGEPPILSGMTSAADANQTIRQGMFKYTLEEFLMDHPYADLPPWALQHQTKTAT